MHLKSPSDPSCHDSPLPGTSRPPCPWSRTWLWRGWRRWARARCRWRSSPPWTSSSGSRILQTRKSEHTKLFIEFNFQYNKPTNNSIFNFSKTHLSNNVLFTSMKCYWHFTMPCCWVFYIYILVDMKKWRVKICILTICCNNIKVWYNQCWFRKIGLRSNVIFIMFMFMISWPCVWNLLVVCCFCWAEKMFCWAELYRGIIGINICVAK